MRHTLLFMVFVLFISTRSTAAVVIAPAEMTVATRARVAAACKGMSRVACTTFRDAWMTCQCERSPDGWSIRAGIRITPVMHLTSTASIGHESMHLDDFRYYLGKHVEAIEGKSFARRLECDSFAMVAMNAFGRTLESIRRISTVLRDGKGYVSSEDHLIVMKAEVVTQFVDDGLADLSHDFASAVSDAKDRTAENRDLIRQRR